MMEIVTWRSQKEESYLIPREHDMFEHVLEDRNLWFPCGRGEFKGSLQKQTDGEETNN